MATPTTNDFILDGFKDAMKCLMGTGRWLDVTGRMFDNITKKIEDPYQVLERCKEFQNLGFGEYLPNSDMFNYFSKDDDLELYKKYEEWACETDNDHDDFFLDQKEFPKIYAFNEEK